MYNNNNWIMVSPKPINFWKALLFFFFLSPYLKKHGNSRIFWIFCSQKNTALTPWCSVLYRVAFSLSKRVGVAFCDFDKQPHPQYLLILHFIFTLRVFFSPENALKKGVLWKQWFTRCTHCKHNNALTSLW